MKLIDAVLTQGAFAPRLMQTGDAQSFGSRSNFWDPLCHDF